VYAIGSSQCKLFRKYLGDVGDLQELYPSIPRCAELCSYYPSGTVCPNPNHKNAFNTRCSRSILIGLGHWYYNMAPFSLF
jgi:hypothetical protein